MVLVVVLVVVIAVDELGDIVAAMTAVVVDHLMIVVDKGVAVFPGVSSLYILLTASWLVNSCSPGEFSLGAKRILHHVWLSLLLVLIVKIT